MTLAPPPKPPSTRITGPLLRHSLKFTLLAWIPGAFWQGATGNTAITPFAQYFHANDLIFSLLIVAGPLLSALLQIPGSLIVARLGVRKRFFIATVTPHRALYILIGLLPWIFPRHASTALLMTALVFLSMGLNNFGGQAWVHWMADLVPPRVRGKFFARRSRMGVAVIALATLLVATILDLANTSAVTTLLAPIEAHTDLPPLIILLSLTFIVAGAIGMIDILLFHKVAEPPMSHAAQAQGLAALRKPFADPLFRRFVAYYSVWTCANSWCTWLWMPYFLQFLQHEKANSAPGAPPWWGNSLFLTAALILPVGFQIGQFLGYPMWGRAVDRFGRKPVFLVSSSLHTLTWISWIFLSPTTLPWMLPIQILGGTIGGGMDVAAFNTLLHFNRKGGPSYQALATVLFSLAGAIAACTAGALATALSNANFHVTVAAGTRWEHTFNHYALLILIGASIKYTADFVFLPRMHDLESKPATHTLRFVFTNFYGPLNTLLFTPLRTTATASRRLWR